MDAGISAAAHDKFCGVGQLRRRPRPHLRQQRLEPCRGRGFLDRRRFRTGARGERRDSGAVVTSEVVKSSVLPVPIAGLPRHGNLPALRCWDPSVGESPEAFGAAVASLYGTLGAGQGRGWERQPPNPPTPPIAPQEAPSSWAVGSQCPCDVGPAATTRLSLVQISRPTTCDIHPPTHPIVNRTGV